jgi:hypothetical protein
MFARSAHQFIRLKNVPLHFISLTDKKFSILQTNAKTNKDLSTTE